MSFISNKKIVLVDGSSYLFRAYHALPPLTNSKGQPTGAIYGVINMLNKLIKDEQPDYIGIVFDTKGKTFREELYPLYKAHRPEMHDDLRSQIQPLHDTIRAMGLPLIAIEGVEADDVIGTLVLKAKDKGFRIVISTGDKDFAQLVNHEVVLVNTMTGSVLDEPAVMAKFGVPPNRITDYLALVGDTVDNVPGVPNVGPKTAAKWLASYGSLENIIKDAHTIKGKVGDNLRASLDHLNLAHQLVTIKQDVPLEIELEMLKAELPDQQALYALYSQLEFKTWLKNLKVGKAEESIRARAIESLPKLEELSQILQTAPLFSFYFERDSLERDSTMTGMAFSVQSDEAYYIPMSFLNTPEVWSVLKTIFENPNIQKIGHNVKKELVYLLSKGIELKGALDDIMLESYIYNATVTRHDLESLALFYLQINQKETHASKDYYLAQNAAIILRLHLILKAHLEEVPSLLNLYQTIEKPLMPVLAHVEQMGVKIDDALLKAQSESLLTRIEGLESEIFALAGEEVNVSSPKQLRELLYTKLKLPVLAKTPTGHASTSEAVLKTLSLTYELPALILEHRSLSKLKATYTDKLPLLIDPKTGRIHTSYHQAVTATGRLSSSDPNLQNIPIRTAEGRKIRKAFIAEKGFVIMAADYSQVELRIMAHFSQDEGLINAFKLGQDIHQVTASEILNIPLDEVTSDQRRSAKAINFGLIYGMSAFGLSKQLGIDRKKAELYMKIYFERYPGVQAYMEKTRALAVQQGFVETLHGRRLYFPDIYSSNQGKKRAAERTAINAPLQGTAADIIKLAMIQLQSWIDSQAVSDKIKMIMQVHDELVFEVAENFVEQAKEAVKQAMEQSVVLSTPLLISMGVGENWDAAH